MECRTCPYRFVIDSKYYDRKEMRRKEVEDVMGGKDAWANVDKTDGVFFKAATTSKPRPSHTALASAWTGPLFNMLYELGNMDLKLTVESQHNVLETDVMDHKHSSTRCRYEVPTSP